MISLIRQEKKGITLVILMKEREAKQKYMTKNRARMPPLGTRATALLLSLSRWCWSLLEKENVVSLLPLRLIFFYLIHVLIIVFLVLLLSLSLVCLYIPTIRVCIIYTCAYVCMHASSTFVYIYVDEIFATDWLGILIHYSHSTSENLKGNNLLFYYYLFKNPNRGNLFVLKYSQLHRLLLTALLPTPFNTLVDVVSGKTVYR